MNSDRGKPIGIILVQGDNDDQLYRPSAYEIILWGRHILRDDEIDWYDLESRYGEDVSNIEDYQIQFKTADYTEECHLLFSTLEFQGDVRQYFFGTYRYKDDPSDGEYIGKIRKIIEINCHPAFDVTPEFSKDRKSLVKQAVIYNDMV